jgi:hypothetical protein
MLLFQVAFRRLNRFSALFPPKIFLGEKQKNKKGPAKKLAHKKSTSD